MSHQPYETWLFDEAGLSSEQSVALRAHLQECEQCRGLQKAWKTLDGKIQATPMVSPQPGFSQRWRASLAERRLRQQARQIRQFFLVLLGAALFTLLLLVITLLITTSPLNLLISAYQSLIRLVIQGNHIQHVFLPLLGSLPPVIPIAAWIILSSIMGLLSILWVGSVWRISYLGVFQK